jgi:hypothetical protein
MIKGWIFASIFGFAAIAAVTESAQEHFKQQERSDKAAIDEYNNRAFEICKDPTVYGWKQEEFCFIYAINLMDRLNKEANVRAFTLSYIFAPAGQYTFSAHTTVLFFTQDNRVFVADNFSGGAMEIDMSKLDLGNSWNSIVDLVDRKLDEVYHPGERYKRWTAITSPGLTDSKDSLLKDFADNANVYFNMYEHAPKFPDSYTED